MRACTTKTSAMLRGLVALALVLGVAPWAGAAVITPTIGTSHWVDGTGVTSGTFTTAVTGQPVPFDTIYGGDSGGPNFSASWTFSGYGSLVGITAASIKIGIWDIDSVATGSQVASFSVGGQDLTAALDALSEAASSVSGTYNIFEVSIPAAAFGDLADGSATFSLSLKEPGSGILGDTTFNGAGLDFSTLSITTTDDGGGPGPGPSPVPEPASLALLLSGASGLLVYGLRRKPRPAAGS